MADQLPAGFWADATTPVAEAPQPLEIVFKCPLLECRYVYRRRVELKEHVHAKHPEAVAAGLVISKPRSSRVGKAFQCPIAECPCGFGRRHDLARHLQRKHPDYRPPPPATTPPPRRRRGGGGDDDAAWEPWTPTELLF